MKPSIAARIAYFRRLAVAFGKDYRGAFMQPVDNGYVVEVRLPRGTVNVFWEPRSARGAQEGVQS